jgi:hypothetical protein
MPVQKKPKVKRGCSGCNSTQPKLKCPVCVQAEIEAAVSKVRKAAYEHAAELCAAPTCNKWSNKACATMLSNHAKNLK